MPRNVPVTATPQVLLADAGNDRKWAPLMCSASAEELFAVVAERTVAIAGPTKEASRFGAPNR